MLRYDGITIEGGGGIGGSRHRSREMKKKTSISQITENNNTIKNTTNPAQHPRQTNTF